MTAGTLARRAPSIANPSVLQARLNYAHELARSGLLPDAFRGRPANVLWALEYAEAISVPAMTAITGIHVIKGKPTASAGLMTALVRRAGHKVRVALSGTVAGGNVVATCTVIRSDDPEHPTVSTWDLDRAVRAELIDRLVLDEHGRTRVIARTEKGEAGSWEKYTENMLKARAESEACRDAAEECLHGLHYTPEELGADVDFTADGHMVVAGEVLTDDPASPAVDVALETARRALSITSADELVAVYRWAESEQLLERDVRAVVDHAPHLHAALGDDRTLGSLLMVLGQRARTAAQSTAPTVPAQRQADAGASDSRSPDVTSDSSVTHGQAPAAPRQPQVPDPAHAEGRDQPDPETQDPQQKQARVIADAVLQVADLERIQAGYIAARPLWRVDVDPFIPDDVLAEVLPNHRRGTPLPLAMWLTNVRRHVQNTGAAVRPADRQGDNH